MLDRLALELASKGHTQFLQVLRVLPYSACQLCSYETYKRLLGGGPDGQGLSVPRRLAAGAAAGMTSTLVRAGAPSHQTSGPHLEPPAIL